MKCTVLPLNKIQNKAFVNKVMNVWVV